MKRPLLAAFASVMLAATAHAQPASTPEHVAVSRAAQGYIEALETSLGSPLLDGLLQARPSLNASVETVRARIAEARLQLVAAERAVRETPIPTVSAPGLDVGLALQVMRQRRSESLNAFAARLDVLDAMQTARTAPDCAAYDARLAEFERLADADPTRRYWDLRVVLGQLLSRVVSQPSTALTPAPFAPRASFDDSQIVIAMANALAPAFACPALPTTLTFDFEFRSTRNDVTRHLIAISDPAATATVTDLIDGIDLQSWRQSIRYRNAPLRLRFADGVLAPAP